MHNVARHRVYAGEHDAKHGGGSGSGGYSQTSPPPSPSSRPLPAPYSELTIRVDVDDIMSPASAAAGAGFVSHGASPPPAPLGTVIDASESDRFCMTPTSALQSLCAFASMRNNKTAPAGPQGPAANPPHSVLTEPARALFGAVVESPQQDPMFYPPPAIPDTNIWIERPASQVSPMTRWTVWGVPTSSSVLHPTPTPTPTPPPLVRQEKTLEWVKHLVDTAEMNSDKAPVQMSASGRAEMAPLTCQMAAMRVTG